MIGIAFSSLSTHVAYMGKREDAVRKALELHSGSERALAREAGVSPALLRFIRSGTRIATPDTVLVLADALERLSGRDATAAHILRKSLTDQEEKDR